MRAACRKEIGQTMRGILSVSSNCGHPTGSLLCKKTCCPISIFVREDPEGVCSAVISLMQRRRPSSKVKGVNKVGFRVYQVGLSPPLLLVVLNFADDVTFTGGAFYFQPDGQPGYGEVWRLIIEMGGEGGTEAIAANRKTHCLPDQPIRA